MQTPINQRPKCGAKTRAGSHCKARVLKGKSKCRMHGGLSTGPKSTGGRARALWNLNGNRNKFANFDEFSKYLRSKRNYHTGEIETDVHEVGADTR